jgi:hypothetical protein
MKSFFVTLILSSLLAFGVIATTQTSQLIHTNIPGTIKLQNVHKGDWLKIIIHWTQGGEVVGVFTDNFFDAWYPSLMNNHSGNPYQEEFEAVAKEDGDLSVNLLLQLHENVFYDVRLEEISH